MTTVDNTKVGNKISRILKKRETSKVKPLKRNWRLVQLMTVLEDYQGVKGSINQSEINNGTYVGVADDQPNYKNEVIYKNVYVTNPLVPMTLSNSSLSLKELNKGCIYQERLPISAKFVAQWLSENIVSSKTYKLTLLCDRIIKAANLNKTISKKVIGQQVLSKKLVGIKVIISGRILGAEIATSKTFKAGQIPSNTIDILKDSGFALAKTRSGTIGVKVIYFWKH